MCRPYLDQRRMPLPPSYPREIYCASEENLRSVTRGKGLFGIRVLGVLFEAAFVS